MWVMAGIRGPVTAPCPELRIGLQRSLQIFSHDPTRHQCNLIHLTILELPFLPFCQGIPESQGLPAKGKKTKETEAWPEKNKSLPFSWGRCWDERALHEENSPFAQHDSTESLTLQTCGTLLLAAGLSPSRKGAKALAAG